MGFMNSGKWAKLALIIFCLISYLNSELFSWLSSPLRSHLYTLDLFILCKRLPYWFGPYLCTQISQLHLTCSYITSVLGREKAQGYLYVLNVICYIYMFSILKKYRISFFFPFSLCKVKKAIWNKEKYI